MIPRPGAHRWPLIGGLGVGLIAAGFVWQYYHFRPTHWSDVDQIWLGARALLAGENPYETVPRGFPYPLYYPLPALLLGLPLAPFPLMAARCLFAFVTATLTTYAVLRHRPSLWILLVSGPFVFAIQRGQWSPLVLAACLIPPWGLVAAAKPTIGLGALAYRPSRAAFLGVAILVLASLAVQPGWPLDLWEAGQQSKHLRAPLQVPAGFMLALALLRWRLPEARLLLALAVVPQTIVPYELLPLAAVPRSRREMLIVAAGWMIVSWFLLVSGSVPLLGHAHLREVGYLPYRWPATLLFGYLPVLFVILRRPRQPAGTGDAGGVAVALPGMAPGRA